MFREAAKWTVLVLGLVAVLAIGIPPIIHDATATHSERMCEGFTREAADQLDGIYQCAQASDCDLDPADFAEYARLRKAQGRTCAGLSSVPPQPLWVNR